MSKKQHTVLTSTTKVKYITLEHDVQQKVWMQRFINELKLNVAILSIILLKNNKSNIKLMHNVKQHSNTKHINVQHQYIWNIVNNEELIKLSSQIIYRLKEFKLSQSWVRVESELSAIFRDAS